MMGLDKLYAEMRRANEQLAEALLLLRAILERLPAPPSAGAGVSDEGAAWAMEAADDH